MGENNNKKSPRIKSFFHYDNFDGKKSVTSWFISPRALLIIRGIICLYSWIVLVAEFTNVAINYGASSFFKYFTMLGFVGLVSYFTTAFYHSYRYVIKNEIPLQNQPQILSWLFWILYHTIVHFSTYIVLTYWIFLSKPVFTESSSPFSWWLNLSVHGLNFLFAMIELFLNRQIMVSSFVILNIIVVILYNCIAFINFGVNSYWVYDFLDITKGPISALWYIGLFVACTIVFFIVYGIHLLRDYIGKRFGRYKDSEDSSDSSLPI